LCSWLSLEIREGREKEEGVERKRMSSLVGGKGIRRKRRGAEEATWQVSVRVIEPIDDP
jgi:hypothetical protein